MTLVVKNTFLEFELNDKARDRETCRRRASSFPASCCRESFGDESDDSRDTEVGSTAGTDFSSPSWGSDALNHASGWPHDDFEQVDALLNNASDWGTQAMHLQEESAMMYSSYGENACAYSHHYFHGFPLANEQRIAQEHRGGFEIAQTAAMHTAAIGTDMVDQDYFAGMMAALRDQRQWSPAARVAPAPKPHDLLIDWQFNPGASGNVSPKHSPTQAHSDSRQRTSAPASPGRKQWSGHKSPVTQDETEGHTTLMLRNLPNDYTRNMLVELLESHGFKGRFDFVYLPFDFKKHAGLGYAFVNMTNWKEATRAMKDLTGFRNWKIKSQKVLKVTWSTPLQGLGANVDRYRNSPVMHPEVPEQFKPLILHNGLPVAFSPPTKPLQAPPSATC